MKRVQEKNGFVWHADSEPQRGPERPEEANERRNEMEDARRTLPLQSGDTGAALGTPLPSGSSDGFSANCHVICFEPFNSSPIQIASQNICFLLI